MAYVQIGILAVVGLLVLGIFFYCFIDLNKDASFQNRRQMKQRPPLRLVKSARRKPKNEQVRRPQPSRGPQRPKGRK